MIQRVLATLCALLIATTAQAGNDFGSREEAKRLADALVEIINTDGIESAVKAVHDVHHPFAATPMGVNLFQNSVVIADNREPEMVAADYAKTADLTGALVWPMIAKAADAEDDAVLKWYHYDTQEVYDFHCYSKRAARDDGLVMICR